MIIQLGVLVLLGSMSTTSALPPCVCTRNLAPVCGSDGRTYNNECLLRCAQVTDQDLIMEMRGRCPGIPSQESCICTFEYKPVCGTDGMTYPNKCSLGCAQRSAPVEMAHEGDCRSKREAVQVAELPLPSCTCPRDYKPVCGTDGQTYPNECELDCDRTKKSELRMLHKGACEQQLDCICPLLYSPVCGTDGQTYDNMCSLGCAQRSIAVEVAHMGDCKTKGETVQVAELPSCTCPRDYEPVCGTDGQTYSNECELDCNRGNKLDLRVQHKGACEQDSGCTCPLLYSPVCGTDGQTYDNMCSLGCAQRSIAVEVAHMGDCKTKRETVQVADLPLPSCTCPRDYEPVCGTNGQTYSNECELDCDRAEKTDLHVQHQGPCEHDLDCICPLLDSPVCGSDDNTYANPCVLRCQSRHNPDLKLSYMGECKEKVKVANPFPAACVCTREMKPVCGTDGNTYSNPCLLRCAREKDDSLRVDHMGPCSYKVQIVEQADNSCTCTRNLQPVCASDGVTYSNTCLMRCAGAHLSVVKDAPCEEE